MIIIIIKYCTIDYHLHCWDRLKHCLFISSTLCSRPKVLKPEEQLTHSISLHEISERMDSTNSSSRDHTKPVIRKRCKYQVRWFYSKGAFLILLWTTLISAAVWSYGTDMGGFASHAVEGRLNRETVSLMFIVIPFLVYITIPLV